MADAEGLRAVMEQLRDIIPLIPERVEGVAQKGSELRKAAESVVHDYKEVQGQAEALFKEIEAELATLREEAARHHAELGGAMEQVQNAVESLKALDTARGELLAGVSQAGQAMDAFQQAIAAGIEEAKHVGEQFRDGLHLVHQMADTGHQAMNKGLDTAHAAATKLQQGMKSGRRPRAAARPTRASSRTTRSSCSARSRSISAKRATCTRSSTGTSTTS